MSDEVDYAVVETMRHVEEFGWALTHVFPTVDDPGVPFTYTTGLQLKDVPELIMMAATPEVAHALLNDIAQKMVDGRVPVDGEVWGDILANDYDVRFREVPIEETATFMTLTRLYGEGFTVMQVLLPDVKNRFPGDEDCDEDFAALQDLEAIR